MHKGETEANEKGDIHMPREQLKKARCAAGFTQQQAANMLNINLRYYKALENGERLGSIHIWDTLEDFTGIHQRRLRELS